MISVIIPYYNAADTIEETVSSVLKQTYHNFEIIIVNDGSPDEMPDAIINNSSIKIIEQENSGQTIARINGAKQAKGEFLCFLDSDDKIDTSYFQKSIDILNQKQEVALVYSKARFFGDSTKKWRLPKFDMDYFLFENFIFISAIHRKSDYLAVGGFDARLNYFEDWELWMHLLSHTKGTAHQIDEELFFYKRVASKVSVLDKGNQEQAIKDYNMEIIYNKHKDFYKENGYSFYDIFRNNRFKYKYKNQWFKKLF